MSDSIETTNTFTQLRRNLLTHVGETVFTERYERLITQFEDYATGSRSTVQQLIATFYQARTGMRAFERPGSASKAILARSLLIIRDVLSGVEPARKYSYRTETAPSVFTSQLQQYEKWMQDGGAAESTVRTRSGRLRIFFAYLNTSSCRSLHHVRADTISKFTASLAGRYTPTGAANILYTLRNFFSCPLIAAKLSFDPVPLLSGIHSRKRQLLASFYTSEEVRRLLNAIDRQSPVGKFLYLMTLLAATYGLRSRDIVGLKLESLEWDERLLRLTQHKTGMPVVLPLLPEVSLAAADYLKNARPDTTDPHVFIRLRAPHVPYATDSRFSGKLAPFLEKAGINTTGKQHGFHALRHSLATTLMANNVPVNQIATVLGHTTVQSTMSYVWSDVEGLRLAARQVEPWA